MTEKRDERVARLMSVNRLHWCIGSWALFVAGNVWFAGLALLFVLSDLQWWSVLMFSFPSFSLLYASVKFLEMWKK